MNDYLNWRQDRHEKLDEVTVCLDQHLKLSQWRVYVVRPGYDGHHLQAGIRTYTNRRIADKRFDHIVATHRAREPRDASQEEINHLFGRPAGFGRFA